MHGFDEFYGNLYHLNAEEEPEQFDYPHKDQFPKLYEFALPRGVLKCKATDEVSDRTRRPEVRPGRQADDRGHRPAGPPSGWRPSTTTSPTAPSTTSSASTTAGNPFFVWCNFTHMHLYTHLTMVPTVNTRIGTARAIAQGLGRDLIAPELEGLNTFDESHLDQESAQRWSAAFLSAAGPEIQKCLADPSALRAAATP